MASFTSKATGDWKTEGATTWNEAGHPVAGDTVTIQNGHVISQSQAEACATCTINLGGQLLGNSNALVMTGEMAITGNWTPGICTSQLGGLSVNSVNSITPSATDDGTVIELSGNYANNYISTTDGSFSSSFKLKMIFKATGSYNYSDTNSGYGWLGTLEIENGATINLANLCYVKFKNLILSGVIYSSTFTTYLKHYNNGTVTLNSTGDFTGGAGGSGLLTFVGYYGATITQNRTAAYSYTGTIRFVAQTYGAVVIPGNYSNALVVMYLGAIANGVLYSYPGTLTCKNWIFFNTVSGTVFNHTPGMNVIVNEGIDFYYTGSTVTPTYTKGTGSITGNGTAAATYTWAFDGKTTEDIIINAGATTIYQLTENVTTDSITVTAGTLDLQGLNVTSTGATAVSGTLKSTTSTGTGLTTAGLTFNAGSVFTLGATNALINNSGNLSIDSASITSGMGTWTFTGAGSGTQTINYDGNTVGAIIINDSGATKDFTEAFTSSALTLTAGTVLLLNGATSTATTLTTSSGILKSRSAGNQATLTITNAGAISSYNTTYQDINATNLIEVYNCTDGLNNTNIDFIETTQEGGICLRGVGH